MSAGPSLNNLVRPQQYRLRDREPERGCVLAVYRQLESSRTFDGEVGRLRATQDTVHVIRSAPSGRLKVGAQGQESTAGSDTEAGRGYWQAVARSPFDDRLANLI